MYTQCPYCQTVFKIGASQLRLGRGQVQCGHCTQPFLALDHLSDTLPVQDEKAISATPFESAAPPPEVTAESPLATQAPAQSVEPGTAEFEPDEAPEPGLDPVYEHVYEPTLGRLDALDQLEADERAAGVFGAAADWPTEETEAEAGSAISATQDPNELQPEVPEVLREDMERIQRAERARRHRWVLLFISLLLTTVLAFQYAWFRPDDLLARYPVARPWLERFCLQAGCRLAEVREPGRIRVLSRDVRIHPGFEGALLINATLSNTAATTQAFPRLQFTLFNVNGQTIAARRFQPKEYLAPETNIAAGMPPERPVQITLEMLAPEQAAVSFEFEFL